MIDTLHRNRRHLSLLAMLLAGYAGLETVAAPGTAAQTPPYGLAQRQPNTTLVASTSGNVSSLGLRQIFTSRRAPNPTFVTHAGDGSGRIFVLEKRGFIHIWSPNGRLLDISDRVANDVLESGLLSLAFHPSYEENGRFFVFYAARDEEGGLFSKIAEFNSSDPDTPVEDTEQVILELPKQAEIHFGGHVAFGPDGYLYVSIGDDAAVGDLVEGQKAQDPTSLYGSMLRLDIDSEAGYAIPPDNPFVENELGWRPEIWAYGLRNTWRYSFDSAANLLGGDVGSIYWEEINLIEKGKNYGWPVMEGKQCHPESPDCDSTGLTLPLVAYAHEGSAAAVGGYVFDHPRLPDLQGAYLYADFVDGRIWALRHDGQELLSNELVAQAPGNVPTFGQDEEGEVYVISGGGTFHVVDWNNPSDEGDVIPDVLLPQDLFSDLESQTPIAGLVPYSVNSELWSDGAFKTRFMAVPASETIQFSKDDFWQFPAGSIIVKNFSLPTTGADLRLIETRLLIKNTETAGWSGFSYMWDEEVEQATLLEGSQTVLYEVGDPASPGGIRQHVHHFPSRIQCRICHTPKAGYVLGVRTDQLNRLHTYRGSESGSTTDHQLRTMNHIGLFDSDIGEEYGDFPRLPDPLDKALPYEERARAYLDANCSQCHRTEGSTPVDMDLRFATPLAATRTLQVDTTLDPESAGTQRIFPGEPDRSAIYTRMLSLEESRMPPLATSRIDEEGADLIRRWIADLSPTDGSDSGPALPLMFALEQNFPNPFNPTTHIPYRLDKDAFVQLTIFDLLGQPIRQLANHYQIAGAHIAVWAGRDDDERTVAAGVYIYRLRAGELSGVRKMVLLK